MRGAKSQLAQRCTHGLSSAWHLPSSSPDSESSLVNAPESAAMEITTRAPPETKSEVEREPGQKEAKTRGPKPQHRQESQRLLPGSSGSGTRVKVM